MADRYWVGGTANWDATAGTKWAATSGGAGGQSVPTSADNVFFDAASGAVTVTISATADCDNLNFTGFTGTIAGTSALNVYGSLTLSTGMTRSYSGTLTMRATATGKTITSNGKTLDNITFAGTGGGWTLQDAFTTTAAITHTNGTFDTNGVTVSCSNYSNTGTATRVLTLGASTFTCTSGSTGPWSIASSTGMTLNSGTSTIDFTATTGSINFAGAGLTYYNVIFSGLASVNIPGITVQGVNTFNNFTVSPPSASNIRGVNFPNNQTITGTLTVSGGSPTRRNYVRASGGVTNITLNVNTLVADDCDFTDIIITGAAAGTAPARAGDRQGNTGITFPASKTVYWNLSGTQNWSATGWATSSGGAPNVNNFPLAQDTAVFDNTGSADTVSINNPWAVGTLNMSARTNAMTLTVGSFTPQVLGDVILGAGVTVSNTSTTLLFVKRGTQTITSNGAQFGCGIEINKTTGSVLLADNLSLVSGRTLLLTAGTFDAVTYNVTAGLVNISGSGNRTLTMGSGTWTLSGTGTVWNAATTTNLTFNRGSANIVLSNTSTAARTFAGGGRTYNKLTIGGATGTSTLTFTGSNTFSEIASTKTVAHTITFTSGTTTTVTTWSVNGTSGNVVTLKASTPGSRATLAKAGGGTVTVNYASIQDNSASPTLTWYATNSIDSGNNLNWNITGVPAAFFMLFT